MSLFATILVAAQVFYLCSQFDQVNRKEVLKVQFLHLFLVLFPSLCSALVIFSQALFHMTLYSLLFSSTIDSLQSRLLLCMIELHRTVRMQLIELVKPLVVCSHVHWEQAEEWIDHTAPVREKMWMGHDCTDRCADRCASFTSAQQKLFLWVVIKTSLKLWVRRVGRSIDFTTASPLQHNAFQHTSTTQIFLLVDSGY